MNDNARRDQADKPLLGAVLCCTSVPPEHRTQFAEYAIQMGAEHKLDLTSDVTHLLVGDTQTLKYQYVAREREDVKVLQPEFVEAVRECWMHDKAIDLNALEAKYRVPTLAGLKICITGFDDLTFRAQLQQAVVENGGEYTGDLTKDVTHLIANAPEGKKYAYAAQWQKKVVGIKWLKDTLDRGMQLDESLYHPTKPKEEQGIGAWNRQARHAQLGKRPRDHQSDPEPPRKLRRTASARLGSQNESLWGDIVGGGGLETAAKESDQLRPSKSMPIMRPETQVAESFSEQIRSNSELARNLGPDEPPRGFFSGKTFHVHNFDHKKTDALLKIILENGGSSSQQEIQETDDKLILLVPYNSSRSTLRGPLDLDLFANIATELWVERCMAQKTFIPPTQYPLGGILQRYPVEGFSSLVINGTGFQGIELLHLSKMTTLLGAKYEEQFLPTTSVLISRTSDPNPQKIRHAQEWNVPIVSLVWLWSCIRNSRVGPFKDYLICPRVERRQAPESIQQRVAQHPETPAEPSGTSLQRQEGVEGRPREPRKLERSLSAKDMLNARRHEELSEREGPGLDFFETGGECNKQRSGATAREGKVPNDDMPLKEISNNSPPKSRHPSPVKKKRLFQTFDGSGSLPETEQQQQPPPPELAVDLAPLAPKETAIDAQAINGAIQDLLNFKNKTKIAQPNKATELPGKKKRLLGRALSNLSNSSLGSNVRASRASSVDSMNTDGVGSEITAETSQKNSRAASSNHTTGRSSFTGRAKPRETLNQSAGASIELGDPGLYRHDHMTEEEPQPLQQTQLAYEDPEEAVKLREKLAERRNRRAREGKVDEDRESEKKGKFERKKITDDEVLVPAAGGGWGGGRRTRQRDNGLGTLTDF